MANWHKHLKDDEKQELMEIKAKRVRMGYRNAEYKRAHDLLMKRAIARMRRKAGKT